MRPTNLRRHVIHTRTPWWRSAWPLMAAVALLVALGVITQVTAATDDSSHDPAAAFAAGFEAGRQLERAEISQTALAAFKAGVREGCAQQ